MGKAAHPSLPAPTPQRTALLLLVPSLSLAAWLSIHLVLMSFQAPKKLIRYIDNQVVSTKGERYKDIKKPESEEMKRTYISLKPARKYKFH